MLFHFDWLSIEQDFGYRIPDSVIRSIFDFGMVGIHLDTGEMQEGVKTPTYRHKGSYCDEVSIRISGSVIRMEGNPSRWGKSENVLGFTDIDSCVNCFNSILYSLGLPLFTKCTEVFRGQGKSGEKVKKYSNGAIIKRLDITTNKAVGKGNERTFIKALSQMRYRNSIGRLHTNGLTVDWLNNTPTLDNRSLTTTVSMRSGEVVILAGYGLDEKTKRAEDWGFLSGKSDNINRSDFILLLQAISE